MQGKLYNSQAQQLILNVYKFFALEKQKQGPFIPVSAAYDRTCAALNISSSSLSKIIRKSQENPPCRPPTPPVHPEKRGKGKVQTIDEKSKEEIRKILHEFCETKIPATLNNMHDILKEKNLFHYSKSSMRSLIYDFGYQFKTKKRKSFLYKRARIKKEVVWVIGEPKDTDENMESD